MAALGRWATLPLVLLGLVAWQPANGQDADPVTLATLDWPPYIGQQLDRRGYVHEIVREALARQGFRLEAQFLPWARAVEMARKGETSGIFPEYFDAERARLFIFSDPFPGGPIGLYKRRNDTTEFSVDPRAKPVAALRALRDRRFGVVRGYANTAAFDAADFLDKDEAVTDAINLKKLAYSRIDLAVIDRYVAAYLLDTELSAYADQLEFMEPPLEDKPLHVAFSRADPRAKQLVAAFNKGLARMRADGSLRRLLQDFGFTPTSPP